MRRDNAIMATVEEAADLGRHPYGAIWRAVLRFTRQAALMVRRVLSIHAEDQRGTRP